MGQATLVAPASMYGAFSKSNLRKKEVYLQGVNWETFDFICMNPKCCNTTNAYGNYVSKLEKENKELKERLKAAPKNTAYNKRLPD